MSPLISICIPTYNRAELLNKSLYSVLREFGKYDVEVIVSDNNSQDNTSNVVHAYQVQYPCVKYYKNETNIGLDKNVISCITKATGEYVFMFSDDDILLSGSAKHILDCINQYKPNLIYLHYRDFAETEDYSIVLHRKTPADKKSVIYQNGSDMFVDLYPSHLSAIIYKREEVVKYLSYIKDNDLDHERGYVAIVLSHYVILESPPPFVYIGNCCVAARAVIDKPINLARAYCVYPINHCVKLLNRGFISNKQIHKIANKRILWHSTKLIALMKVSKNKEFTKEDSRLVWKMCKRFALAYFCILPVILLPDYLLSAPLHIALNYRIIRNKVTGLSDYE